MMGQFIQSRGLPLILWLSLSIIREEIAEILRYKGIVYLAQRLAAIPDVAVESCSAR